MNQSEFVEEFRVTFLAKYAPEGMDPDGWVTVEAVNMDDATMAADTAYPHGWGMVYRASQWDQLEFARMFPAGEIGRLTTGRATILLAAEAGPVLTDVDSPVDSPVDSTPESIRPSIRALGVELAPWQAGTISAVSNLGDPNLSDCPSCGPQCGGHEQWETFKIPGA